MTQRSYEETQITPSEIPVLPHHADVVATIGDPQLREAADHALMIKAIFGDNEAFLAEKASEIVANIRVVATTLSQHPERAVASVLAQKPYDEKIVHIERIRAMLDRLEAAMEPEIDVPTTAMPVMLTGTRTPKDEDGVRKALVRVLSVLGKDREIVGIAGGAAGADQLWAEALIEAECHFILVVPNWAYPYNYGREEDFARLKDSEFCLGITYSVDRPHVENWKERWGAEKWWTDNFARNRDMIEMAQRHDEGAFTIVGPNHPREILDNRSIPGGTAACTRDLAAAGVKRAVYISSDHPEDIVWVNF